MSVSGFIHPAISGIPSIPATTLNDCLRQTATRFAQKGIVHIGEKGEVFQSYSSLLSTAERFAAVLQQMGFASGDQLILLPEHSEHFVIAFWACILSGIVPAPMPAVHSINTETIQSKRLFNTCHVLKAPLLCDSVHQPSYHFLKTIADKNDVPLLAAADIIREGMIRHYTFRQPALVSTDTAVIQFSSGSTGQPKGVQLSHKNIITNVNGLNERMKTNDADCLVFWMPYYHDFGLFGCHMRALLAGMSQVHIEPGQFVKNPLIWLQSIQNYKGTITASTNTGLQVLTKKLQATPQAAYDLRSLKYVCLGAEHISMTTCLAFNRALRRHGLHPTALFPGYGLAEATLVVTAAVPGEEIHTIKLDRHALYKEGKVKYLTEPEVPGVHFVGAGTPIADFTIHICDEEGNRLPENTIGEITVQGESVTTGYKGNNEATRQVIKNNWLYTGDMGFIDGDGRLFITSRKKELIKKNGVSYFPSDVENIVWNIAGATIKQVIACGYHDPANGKEELLVFIVPTSAKNDVTQALNSIVQKEINEIIGFPPDHVIPIKSNQVPRTSSAKIMRTQLVQLYREGAFHPNIIESIAMNKTIEPIAPGLQETRDMISRLWHETLELPLSYPIDASAGFFSLGGDSIRSIKTIALLEETFHCKVPPNFIYLYPTVADQSRFFVARDKRIIPPANELELILRDVVANCINKPAEHISMTEKLINMVSGFDEAVTISRAIGDLFDSGDMANHLFKKPTLREMADYIQHTVLDEKTGNTGKNIFPLMNFQETLYYHSKSFLRNEPTGLSCYIIYRIPVSGTLNVALYNKAFNHLIDTHPMLRTVIYEDGDTPAFATLAEVPAFEIIYRDIAHLDKTIQAAWLKNADKEDHNHRFNLTQYPLFYAKVYKLSDTRHELVIHIDHQLVDGYSFVQLVKELFETYDRLCSGEEPALTTTGKTFRYYTLIEKLREKLPAYKKALEFALNVFRDIPPKIALPYKKDPALIDKVQFETFHTTIPAGVMQTLTTMADQNKEISLNALLLACYFRLMHTWTNESDCIINMPIYNRNHHFPVAGKVVGSFLDIFPVRVKMAPGESILSIARTCEQFIRTLLQYPVSSIELTRRIAAKEGLHQGSLSNIIFSNSINMIPKGQMSGLQHVKLGEPLVHTGAPGTVIDLVMYTWEGKWCFDWNYVTSLLDEGQIRTMACQYEQMLQELAAIYSSPGTVENYTGGHLLPDSYLQLLKRNNQTTTAYPVTTIHEWIATQTTKTPQKTAVTYEGSTLTYQQLDEAANQFAQLLVQLGAGPDTFVALIHSRSIDLLVAQLGILKAGAAYVPIDPNYPAERIAYMLNDSGAGILITQLRYTHLIDGMPVNHIQYCLLTDQHHEWPVLKNSGITVFNRTSLAACSSQMPSVTVHAGHLMYMIYTSGSTGEPKGVMVTHKNACNFLYYVQQAFTIRTEERVALVTSYSFDMTITSNWVALLTGASVHILNEERTKDIEQLLFFLEEEQITFLNITPSHFSLLVNTLKLLPEPLDLQQHMTIMLGAEIINPNDLNNWLQHYPLHRFINEYGPTETTVASTFFPIPVNEAHKVSLSVVPIGKPIYNTQVYILNDNKEHCMPGVPGTLYIGGAGVTKGYLNKKERTEKVFITDPVTGNPHDIVYNTGDLAKFTPDGNIIFLGRKDHQVNIKGYRIELGDIEAALTTVEGVAEACAAMQKDNNGELLLVAFYTARLTIDLSHAKIAAHLAGKLPEHMIPVAFQQISKIPVNANGKLDRRMLPHIAISGNTGKRAAYVSPRTAMEKAMIDLWEEVLSISQLGIHDNFWHIGGDSIKSVRLIQKIKEAGYHTIRIRDIFSHPSVASMCAALENAGSRNHSDNLNTITLIKNNGQAPVLFCLPYAAGNPGMYAEFSRQLNDQYEVIGAQYPGHGDSRPLLSSIEDYADLYMQLLSETKTPLFILGYSFGGYIAFDICRKLEERGKEIAGLILVGTTPPNTRDQLMNILDGKDTATANSYISRNLESTSLLHDLSEIETATYMKLLTADTRAMLQYRFPDIKLKTPALFITGTEEEDEIIKNEKQKWQHYMEHCSFKEIPGNHLLIKRYPLQLAKAVQVFTNETIFQ